MPNFDTGVSSYITGTTAVTVYFPVDNKGHADVSCGQCQFYGRSSKTCQLTKRVVHFPDKYIGDCCPLEFEDEERK